MTRKIAIIGGTDAVQVLLNCVSHRDTMDSVYQDDEIVWIRDCSHIIDDYGIQTESEWGEIVGENTTLSSIHLSRLLDGKQKWGKKFIGFGNDTPHNFYVLYELTHVGWHLNGRKMVDLFWNSYTNTAKNVRMIDAHVDSIDVQNDCIKILDEKYDFVIDCTRGALWDHDSYSEALYNPTNASLTVHKNVEGKWNYTAHIAGKHGYLTGIPIKDAQTWIYSYDKDITTLDDAILDFNNHCEITTNELPKISEYDKLLSDYCIHPNNRYARCGRALGFNDELNNFKNYLEGDLAEAISMYLFEDPERQQTEYQRLDVEDRYQDGKKDCASSLGFYLQEGSQYKTEFWEQTRTNACLCLENREYFDISTNLIQYEYLKMNELIPPEENIRLDYFRRLANDEQRLRQKQTAVSDEPYRLLGSYQIFTETTRGLGSPYAHLFPVMTDMLPPSSEPFGEINLDPIIW